MNATDGGGADLLAPLRDVDFDDSPPPGYDVAEAIRRAGTIRRRRFATGAFTAATLVVAVVVPLMLHRGGAMHSANAAGTLPFASCTGRAIATPAGAGDYTSVVGAAIDPTGRYLALTVARPEVPNFEAIHAMLVDRRTNTTTVIPIDVASAVAVNSSGMVTGWTDSDQMSAWVYDGHQVVTLPYFDYEAVTPTAIGSNGDVVGYATNHEGTETTAVIWPAGSPRTVHALDGTGSMAWGVADDGTVGGSRDVYGLPAAAVWDTSGEARLLPTNDVVHQGSVRGIAGHFAAGEVTAYGRAAVWNLATGELRLYSSTYAFLWVSSNGTAVGGVQGSNSMVGAVIARDGHVWRLPDIDRLDGQTATGASDDAKTIVGSAFSGTQDFALLWTC